MEMKASDLSARLLATENLSVIRARTRTASFDIKSRILTLPMWKDMTPEIEDMLIGHEVGHALYTNDDYLEPLRDTPKLHSYMNVLEDVRIEKLIKRKYPGLRKRMNEGYKQLNDRDFFGTKQVQDFDELLLIDKINLYFKAGFQCGVSFTPEEKVFVNRAERTETVDEIIELANDIYAYSKQVAEERKQRMQFEDPSELEEDDEYEDDLDDPIFGDFDIDADDDFEEENGEDKDLKPAKKSKPKLQNDDKAEVSEQELESKTERAFQNKLEDLADDSTEYRYWKFDTDYYKDPVIGYKRILNETKSPREWDASNPDLVDYKTRNMDEEQLAKFKAEQSAEFVQFKIDSIRTVNYLVKEFEMKKSAQMHKRASVSKIGSLDMKKVYAYKLQDDLFKRVTSLPQGKNHGMILLVDWSGSMNEVLQDTVKQVINLAMFCNRVQIPYRVFAFTSDYQEKQQTVEEHESYNSWYGKKHNQEDLIATSRGFHLLEFFNSKMTTSEFNSMSARLLDYRFFWNEGYNTGGTPLNEALVYCYDKLGAFIKNNNIEKTTFITLTDGEGGSLNTYRYGRFDDTRTEVVNGVYKRIKIKNFIKDEVTQKTYEIGRLSGNQTEMILRMIKDRYNVTLVGFHICQNRGRDLRGVLSANLPDFNGDVFSVVEKWKKDFRNNGFTSVMNTGRDELFLIPQSSTKIQEGELDVKADANAKAIAKNFSKFLNVKKTSRILLNRFVTLVA
jgi:hypothetical protein